MKKTTITYFALIVLLGVTFYFALTHGASKVSFTNLTNTQLNVLFNIRLPRIFSDLVAGAALSVSGAFFRQVCAIRLRILDLWESRQGQVYLKLYLP